MDQTKSLYMYVYISNNHRALFQNCQVFEVLCKPFDMFTLFSVEKFTLSLVPTYYAWVCHFNRFTVCSVCDDFLNTSKVDQITIGKCKENPRTLHVSLPLLVLYACFLALQTQTLQCALQLLVHSSVHQDNHQVEDHIHQVY